MEDALELHKLEFLLRQAKEAKGRVDSIMARNDELQTKCDAYEAALLKLADWGFADSDDWKYNNPEYDKASSERSDFMSAFAAEVLVAVKDK